MGIHASEILKQVDLCSVLRFGMGKSSPMVVKEPNLKVKSETTSHINIVSCRELEILYNDSRYV